MLNDSLTISLLPALDATLHPDGEWLFPGMESRMNENGVYTEDIKEYKTGKWNTYCRTTATSATRAGRNSRN